MKWRGVRSVGRGGVGRTGAWMGVGGGDTEGRCDGVEREGGVRRSWSGCACGEESAGGEGGEGGRPPADGDGWCVGYSPDYAHGDDSDWGFAAVETSCDFH